MVAELGTQCAAVTTDATGRTCSRPATAAATGDSRAPTPPLVTHKPGRSATIEDYYELARPATIEECQANHIKISELQSQLRAAKRKLDAVVPPLTTYHVKQVIDSHKKEAPYSNYPKRIASIRDVVESTAMGLARVWEGRMYIIREAGRLRFGVRGRNADWECIYEGDDLPDGLLHFVAGLKDRYA